MLFKYFPTPLMEEIDATGGSVTATTTEIPEGTTGDTTGAAVPIPDGNKPDAAWAEMRRKAKLADDLLKENEGYKAKFEKINKQALPEGYKSVDEYLESLDNEIPFVPEETSPQPVISKDVLAETVKNIINEHPIFKQAQKTQQDTFLVNSFKKAQEVFPDIKKPEDIPMEVWDAWDEGKSNRTLLSHLKEHRYDSDIENARKSGANQAKATVMSTAHTAQVNGTNTVTEYDNVVVPEATRKQLERAGITDPMKQKYYYAKHHRTE